MIKRCVVCDGEFEARTTGKYCSPDCRLKSAHVRSNDRWRKKRDADPMAYRNCVVCESAFRVFHGSEKTCSLKCSETRRLNYNREYMVRRRSDTEFRKFQSEKDRARRPRLPLLTRTCRFCKSVFEGRRCDVYCSKQCKKKRDAAWIKAKFANDDDYRDHIRERDAVRTKERWHSDRTYRKKMLEYGRVIRSTETAALRAFDELTFETGSQKPISERHSKYRSKPGYREHRHQYMRNYLSKAENVQKIKDRNRNYRLRRRAARQLLKELETKGIGALL